MNVLLVKCNDKKNSINVCIQTLDTVKRAFCPPVGMVRRISWHQMLMEARKIDVQVFS